MNKIVITLLTLTALATGWNFYRTTQVPKIAYVRSGDLVYEYIGTKEARKSYDGKSQLWQSNLDTLKSDFQRAVSDYNLHYSSLTDKEKAEREKLLRQQENNIGVYAQNIQKQVNEEDTKMMQGVLNQVNAFAEEYAKQHGYDLIVGTTTSGNVLYGTTAMDITDDLLKAMNENYKPEIPTGK